MQIDHCLKLNINIFHVLGTYERLKLEFRLRRISSHYIVMTYLPSLVLVLVGTLLFWLPVSALAERAFFGAFLLLAMTAILAASQYGTPQVSAAVQCSVAIEWPSF